MPDAPQIIYWDANAFLSYVNEEGSRMPVLAAILDRAEKGEIQLRTSEISRAEVAFGASEQTQRALDAATEELIDNLWDDTETLLMVEYHSDIGNRARALMRYAITQGWSLKPLDAIHLATAQWLVNNGVKVDEFHTYDGGLVKYAQIVGCTICEPHTAEPRML